MYRKIYITNITYNIPLLVIEVQRFYVEACNLIFFVTTRQHQVFPKTTLGTRMTLAVFGGRDCGMKLELNGQPTYYIIL
jgi:hypothetical protein